MGDSTGIDDRIRVYRQLRSRSDLVRTQLIPGVMDGEYSAARTFFDMTQAYFEGDVLSGQLLNELDLSKVDNPGGKSEPYQPTMDELSRPRTHRCKVYGFEAVHPRYLKGISDILFSAIDNDRMRRRRGQFDLDFMVVVNFFLQLMHIAEDGTGRTGEDMLVLLAGEAGRTWSVSQTGYRGALDGVDYPVLYKTAAQRVLFFELVENFYKYLGLATPKVVSFEIDSIVAELGRVGSSDGVNRLAWPDGTGPAIVNIYKQIADDPGSDSKLFESSHPYRFFAEFLACELIYFSLCLEIPSKYMPGLKSRYPASVNCAVHSIMLGLGREYQTIPDGISGPCDEAVALIESVRMGWSSRDDSKLDAAVKRIESEDKKIGELFRQQLSVFMTEDEKKTIQFQIPQGMTGEYLENQIKAAVRKARA
jgi:hypothetical protein